LIAALQLLQKSESDLALFETPKLTKFEYFIEVCCTLQFIHTSFLYGVAPEDKDEKMLNCRCEMIQILDEREARGFFSSELKNCTWVLQVQEVWVSQWGCEWFSTQIFWVLGTYLFRFIKAQICCLGVGVFTWIGETDLLKGENFHLKRIGQPGQIRCYETC
jgi:hypothetical protein